MAIARAVILRPQLILADEVTGNLDSKNSEMIIDLLTRLNEATQVSILSLGPLYLRDAAQSVRCQVQAWFEPFTAP